MCNFISNFSVVSTDSFIHWRLQPVLELFNLFEYILGNIKIRSWSIKGFNSKLEASHLFAKNFHWKLLKQCKVWISQIQYFHNYILRITCPSKFNRFIIPSLLHVVVHVHVAWLSVSLITSSSVHQEICLTYTSKWLLNISHSKDGAWTENCGYPQQGDNHFWDYLSSWKKVGKV